MYKEHFVSYKMNDSNTENAEALIKDSDILKTQKDFGDILLSEFNIYNKK